MLVLCQDSKWRSSACLAPATLLAASESKTLDWPTQSHLKFCLDPLYIMYARFHWLKQVTWPSVWQGGVPCLQGGSMNHMASSICIPPLHRKGAKVGNDFLHAYTKFSGNTCNSTLSHGELRFIFFCPEHWVFWDFVIYYLLWLWRNLSLLNSEKIFIGLMKNSKSQWKQKVRLLCIVPTI